MREIDIMQKGDIPIDPSPPLGEEEVKLIEKPPALKDLHALVGRPLKVDIPGGEISKAGIFEIDRSAQRYPSYPEAPTYAKLFLPSEEDESFEWRWLTKKGSLPKRLSKWIQKKYPRAVIPQEFFVEVGNIAKRNCDEGSTYFFEFTNQINWGSKEMGQSDNGSCWWSRGSNGSWDRPQSNSYCTDFTQEGGLGIKFFPNDDARELYQGIGRIWLMIEQESKEWGCLFNGYWYGQGATLRLARVIATYMGLSYLKFGVVGSHRYYVNGDSGYYVGEEAKISSLPTLGISIPRVEPRVNCCICSTSIPLVTSKSLGIEKYCYSCYAANTSACNHCTQRYKSSTAIWVNAPRSSTVRRRAKYNIYGELVKITSRDRIPEKKLVSYCPGCASSNAMQCHICLVFHKIYDPYESTSSIRLFTWMDDQEICVYCASDASKCQDCESKTLNVDAMGDPTCKSCEDQFEDEIDITLNEIRDLEAERRELEDRSNGCMCKACRPDLIDSYSFEAANDF